MTVLYHPAFADDIRRFGRQYAEISATLELRFRAEVNAAISAISANPTAVGHLIDARSLLLREVRRHNLPVFPFFVLYGFADNQLLFASLIPRASDPLTWLKRFQ